MGRPGEERLVKLGPKAEKLIAAHDAPIEQRLVGFAVNEHAVVFVLRHTRTGELGHAQCALGAGPGDDVHHELQTVTGGVASFRNPDEHTADPAFHELGITGPGFQPGSANADVFLLRDLLGGGERLAKLTQRTGEGSGDSPKTSLIHQRPLCFHPVCCEPESLLEGVERGGVLAAFALGRESHDQVRGASVRKWVRMSRLRAAN